MKKEFLQQITIFKKIKCSFFDMRFLSYVNLLKFENLTCVKIWKKITIKF